MGGLGLFGAVAIKQETATWKYFVPIFFLNCH
jgi:hypothetical protein